MTALGAVARAALLVGTVAIGGCVTGTGGPAGRGATSTPTTPSTGPGRSAVAAAPSQLPTPQATTTIGAWSDTAGITTCDVVDSDDVEGVVASAFSGLGSTTAESDWSSACAWVRSVETGALSYLLSVTISWQGTLIDFSSLPNARSIAGIADEAVAFDEGCQVALRDGELVAVVAVTRSIDHVAAQASAARAAALIAAARILGQG